MGLSVNTKSLGIRSPAGGKTDTSSLRAVGTTKVRINGQVLDKKTSMRQIRTLRGLQQLSSRGVTAFPAVLGVEASSLSTMSAIGISTAPAKDANYELLSEITQPELIANPNILDKPIVFAPGSTDILKSIDKSFPDPDDPIRQPDTTILRASAVAATATARLATGKRCSKLVSDLCLINLDPSYNSTTKYFKSPETSPKESTYKRRDKTSVMEAPERIETQSTRSSTSTRRRTRTGPGKSRKGRR